MAWRGKLLTLRFHLLGLCKTSGQAVPQVRANDVEEVGAFVSATLLIVCRLLESSNEFLISSEPHHSLPDRELCFTAATLTNAVPEIEDRILL